MDLLAKAKVALRIKTDAFDDEITGLIEAAKSVIETRGVRIDPIEPMVLQAILTYVRLHFGHPDDYDRLKDAWETQLGQLMVTSGYTTWTT